MVDDKGQIAIDFLLGISLFLIALIFTVQFIPGMFMAGSAREGSLDYTAYRTATILTEDTGWWGNSTTSGTDWENHQSDIKRIGLAIDDDPTSRLTDSPNLLSKNKTIQLMNIEENELIEALGLYNNVDNTHFSYGYNISVTRNGAPLVLNSTRIMLGKPVPPDREVTKMKRMVLVESGSLAYFDGQTMPHGSQPRYTIINITGPLNDDAAIYITNLNISSNTTPTPQFKELWLDGSKLTSGYSTYKMAPNGTVEEIDGSGKLENTDQVIFEISSDLLNVNKTYQIELRFSSTVSFNPYVTVIPEYRNTMETRYEPCQLTVEVWQ